MIKETDIDLSKLPDVDSITSKELARFRERLRLEYVYNTGRTNTFAFYFKVWVLLYRERKALKNDSSVIGNFRWLANKHLMSSKKELVFYRISKLFAFEEVQFKLILRKENWLDETTGPEEARELFLLIFKRIRQLRRERYTKIVRPNFLKLKNVLDRFEGMDGPYMSILKNAIKDHPENYILERYIQEKMAMPRLLNGGWIFIYLKKVHPNNERAIDNVRDELESEWENDNIVFGKYIYVANTVPAVSMMNSVKFTSNTAFYRGNESGRVI